MIINKFKNGNINIIKEASDDFYYGDNLTYDGLYNEMTMSLPIQILTKLNADFDGDTLNIHSIKSNKLKRKLKENFNPANSFFISRNDGLFDRQSFLLKDQMIGLFSFCTI